MAMIIVFLVIPALVRVQWRERRARMLLEDATAADDPEPFRGPRYPIDDGDQASP